MLKIDYTAMVAKVFDDYMRLFGGKFIHYSPTLALGLRSVRAAIVYEQLRKVGRVGGKWMWKNHRELCRENGFDNYSQQRALRILIKKGLVEERNGPGGIREFRLKKIVALPYIMKERVK